MKNTVHRITEFLKYQRSAKTKYYLHSPFVYQFYLDVLESPPPDELNQIQELRKKLSQTYNKILIDDMGAAPVSKDRMVSGLVSQSSIPHQYGLVLYRLVKRFSPHHIIELGTCLGLGTAYIAIGAPGASIRTIEGSQALRDIAEINLSTLNIHNVDLIQGNFDNKLPEVLKEVSRVDFVYIDGNHRYEPTMRYFELLMKRSHEGTILVFDDIYWSIEMTQAWESIKKDPRISLTIDIYRFGIAFMHGDKLTKEDFVLRY